MAGRGGLFSASSDSEASLFATERERTTFPLLPERSEGKEGWTDERSDGWTGWSFFGPNPAIRSKSSGAAHPAGFPLLSGVGLSPTPRDHLVCINLHNL